MMPHCDNCGAPEALYLAEAWDPAAEEPTDLVLCVECFDVLVSARWEDSIG